MSGDVCGWPVSVDYEVEPKQDVHILINATVWHVLTL